MNIQEMRIDPTVHKFTKVIVEMAQTYDPVDAIADVELALEVLKTDWEVEHDNRS